MKKDLDIFKEVDSLDQFQKAKIYMHYYITQKSMFYNSLVVDIHKSLKGLSKPDKTYKGLAFYYLWNNINIKTLEEFISEDNIVIVDNGEDWGNKFFGSRYTIKYSGVYDWLIKFREEIVLVS
jgi:hypothetical protein